VRKRVAYKRCALHDAVLDEILVEHVAPRDHRRDKRGVKCKMSNLSHPPKNRHAAAPYQHRKVHRIAK
jgi:hypothetical protein